MRVLIMIVFAAAVAGLSYADNGRFEWKGAVAPGQAIEIKDVNGSIHAEPGSSGQVEVTANKTGKNSTPADVRVDVVPHGDGVTICAVYPSTDGRPNECKPGHGGHMNVNRNDVRVEFTVRVPKGVRFIGRTVNGGVDAQSLTALAEAHTVNGKIRISTAGEAQADTVNGSIDASLGSTSGTSDLKFSSVNGAIHLDLPRGLNAQVKATTVNGTISSDFPLTVHGKFARKSIEGTAGTGGRELKLSTVNGSIHLGQKTL